MKKVSGTKNAIVIGFALFAMFFGAGNLIFPPDLGLHTGHMWWLGFLFYFAADLGLGILAILAMLKIGGETSRIAEPLGKIPSAVIISALIICIGPGLAIPRTAATTYELGIVPLLSLPDGGMTRVIFSVIFFSLVLLLTVRPGKVIDIIGKVLTPVLLVSLLVMIVKGISAPGAPIAEPAVENVVREGVSNGYQTLDMVAAIFFSIILLGSIKEKGYSEESSIRRMALKASLIASALLFLVYGGLTYLGASTGNLFRNEVMDGQLNQAGFLTAINNALLGRGGTVVLALVVASACLTTAIGLVSSAAEFFVKLSGGRISYGRLAAIICFFSAMVCNLGLSRIISIAAPILMLLYPVTILMTVTVFLREKISSVVPYRASAAVAFVISFLEMLDSTFGIKACGVLIAKLPFSSYGFGWVLPAVTVFTLVAAAVAIGEEENRKNNLILSKTMNSGRKAA